MPLTTPGTSAFFWLFHAAYWLGLWGIRELFAGVFPGSAEVTGPAFGVRVAVGCVATGGLRMLSLRKDLVKRLGLSRFGVLAGGCICLAVAMTLVRQRLEPSLGIAEPLTGPGHAAAIFLLSLTGLLGWMFCYLTFRLIEDHDATFIRELEARAEADRHELKHLQATMDPHFLFNALSAVMAIKHDPEEVERVTQALADYLRFRLRDAGPLEPLGREIDSLEDYIAIQDARFGEDLVCSIACERSARPLLVPPLLIQPLLENALKYGADTSPRPLRVEVRVQVSEGLLRVEVANTGQWVAPRSSEQGGLGMRTLRKRLRMRYGDDATLSHAATDGWVRVSLAVPADGPGSGLSDVASEEAMVLR